ncbi:uncharacterized protein J4E84_001702 [Alternaria hordeiaustralica]|uniref:uncharacterized protein n=1 Tax=Alternaria hordeiaustralica TaxID=1187925 RepID=UPI0020C28B87|nr:uncharacterized protein J4E84_001702 [Alternaria hordeiaustralica]KAI4695078.1 hypothetical protein J4E84_001702 [Alternaria hordeiaustralica]
MALKKQVSTDSEGKTKSRIATTPVDRLRVAVRNLIEHSLPDDVAEVTTQKQQLQCSNNAQTKLHTMFEEMMQELEDTKNKLETTEEELESTKDKLDSTQDELNDTKEELESSQDELETTKDELDETKVKLNAANLLAQNNHKSWKTAHDDYRRTKSILKSQRQTNEDLETKLAFERKKAKKNETAQIKLEQLKSQWSSLSHMLGNEDTKL